MIKLWPLHIQITQEPYWNTSSASTSFQKVPRMTTSYKMKIPHLFREGKAEKLLSQLFDIIKKRDKNYLLKDYICYLFMFTHGLEESKCQR